MTEAGETNSKSTDGATHPGGEASRIEIIEEIANLSNIPVVKDYLSGVLLEVKEKFKDKIKEYHRLKDNIKSESSSDKPDQIEEEKISELSKVFEKNKTYFFEMTRFDDSEGKWKLGKFKFKYNGKIVNIIFGDFIKNVDQYEVTPQRIQDEIVDVPSLDKQLQINFTKSSPTRVVGFVKEYKIVEEKSEEKGKEEKLKEIFIVKSNRNMLKLAITKNKPLEVDKEELEEHLQNNPEFIDHILFSIRMKQAFDSS